MSNEIKITANKIETEQFLEEKDLNLLGTYQINSTFDTTRDVVELHFYSLDGSYLGNENYLEYKVERQGNITTTEVSTLLINLEEDARLFGYGTGDVRFEYKFLRDLFFIDKQTSSKFFIESFSPDRTEIRASSLIIPQEKISQVGLELKDRFETLPYLDNIKLNFGNNKFSQVINIGIQNRIEETVFLLIKLYEPLADEFDIKNEFNVNEELSDAIIFDLISEYPVEQEQFPQLKGPNFSTELLQELSNPSEYVSKQDILLSLTGSNYQAISLVNQSGISLGIDHTDFSNFVHFSSATERLENFRYKLIKLEEYEESRKVLESNNPIVVSGSIDTLNNLISGIIQNFDHYERFLYFESGSESWPKVNNIPPYINQKVNTTQATDWFNQKNVLATFYDQNNPYRLLNSVPTYLKDDDNNTPYSIFIDMLGEFFDNLWIYAKAVTDRYNADNRINFGISKDLVADALRGFGIKLYGSDSSFENLFSMFTGEFYQTGSEQISTFVTGSDIPISLNDYQKEIYKRLYHNIPILLKSKGTERGLRALINTFGVPKDILNITYFGGSNSKSSIFLGSEFSTTSSLDRIRIDNTGSMVEGDTLSYFTSINLVDDKYSEDLHILEIGFSPSDNINNYILDNNLLSGSFNIDNYIGDPRFAYTSNYKELKKFTKNLFSGSFTEKYNLYDFVRLVKFYDNTLFKMIKDFVPARTSTSTGIIIKPHILERSKIKQVQSKWSKQTLNTSSNLDYIGSEYETNFLYDGNIKLVSIGGGNAGGFNSGSISGSFTNISYINEYDTRFTYFVKLADGGTSQKQTHGEEKITGEFGKLISNKSGSRIYDIQSLEVTTGELNDENVFKRTNLQPYFYLIRGLQLRTGSI